MNGKVLKVSELELKFGQQARFVNVFGVFRYKKNNNLYIIYADQGTEYSYVCYGTSHVKNNIVLSMLTNKESDTEIIKEYIFKVTNDEKLDDFEIINLDDIEEVEIISSRNFEIKKEVLISLIEKTIPKDEIPEEESNSKKKKKNPLLSFILIVLFLSLAASAYFYYMNLTSEVKPSKIIYCKKIYNHNELSNVSVEEEKTFKFNNSDILEELDTNMTYKFLNESNYLDFINKALYYNYMPQETDDTKGSYKIDNDNKIFSTNATTRIDDSYNDPIKYEEVLFVSKKDNYSCEEKIEK